MSHTSDMLPLPELEHIQLARSPLALAVCQIQFAPILSVADPAFVGPFQQAIQEQYPVANQRLQIQVSLNENGASQTQSPQWEFVDREQTWKIVLTQTFLAIETRSYSDFADFLDQLESALDALFQHIRPTVGLRLGLRYVDELRGYPGKWDEVVSRDLLGPLASPVFRANTTQALGLQQITLRYPKDRGVTIFHGPIATGSTVRPRSDAPEPEGEFYLLDCDVYQDFSPVARLPMQSLALRRLVEEYHEVSYRLFRWAVLDSYLRSLQEA